MAEMKCITMKQDDLEELSSDEFEDLPPSDNQGLLTREEPSGDEEVCILSVEEVEAIIVAQCKKKMSKKLSPSVI
jgi:hypothetical protein